MDTLMCRCDEGNSPNAVMDMVQWLAGPFAAPLSMQLLLMACVVAQTKQTCRVP